VYRLIAFGGQPAALAISGLLLQGVGPVATAWLITLPQAVLVLATTLSGYLRNSHVDAASPGASDVRVTPSESSLADNR
jgi:hypothetical protein